MTASLAPTTPAHLAALLQFQAAAHGDRTAFTFLSDGETPGPSLTYTQLDGLARAIAARLLQSAQPGDRAMLLYAPGLDYVAAFWGCLYAGLVAVPVYPPRDAKSLDRLLAIAKDARAKLALTTVDLLAQTRAQRWLMPALRAMKWLATDATGTTAGDYHAPALTPGDIAFLQYTSGSTGIPKGVKVGHANLLHNASMLDEAWTASDLPDSGPRTFVSWLPLYHDMGLIGKVVVPVAMGGSSVLMSPLHFLQNPLRWLKALSAHGAAVSAGPNFAYDLCARKITPELASQLDLSQWRVAMNGAEPVRAETMRRFAAALKPAGFRWEAFYPCYGLAEATVFVTGGLGHEAPRTVCVQDEALGAHRVLPAVGDQLVVTPLTEALDVVEAGRTLVGVGRSWGGQDLRIVDPETHLPCAPEAVGEVWVAGPSVTSGYWRRDEETAHAFGARLATGEGPYMRTGDLGFLADGELFVTGRLKDLIIIRGRNVYPQDVERTVIDSHSALRPGSGAAFSIEVDGEERLVVVQEVDKRAPVPSADEVTAAVRRAVSEAHEVTLYALVLATHGSLPKTSSGKIQRHRARDAYSAGKLSTWKADVR